MKKVPRITVPLCPIVKKGEDKPLEGRRLRPADALNLKFMLDQLNESTIKTIQVDGKPWSIIPTVSPYSADFHVMLMETSKNRYLPSLEYVSDAEGNLLMKVWIEIIKHMREKSGNIYVGYNWSARSWGIEEEKGGFQSIPTKWHGMFWTWPDFNIAEDLLDTNKDLSSITGDLSGITEDLLGANEDLSSINSELIDFIKEEDVPLSFRRLNGEGFFACDMVKDFKEKIDEIKDAHCDSKVSSGISEIENGAYIVKFDGSLESILSSENFFSNFLKPIAEYLNNYFADLTDIFFKEIRPSFSDMLFKRNNIYSNYLFKKTWSNLADKVLRKTSNGMISKEDYEFLQSMGDFKEDQDIISLLFEKGFSIDSAIGLFMMAKNRRDGDYSIAWRKGFAYTLTFNEMGSKTILKITPGAFLGPAGVVESLGVILQRPEDRTLSNEELVRKSEELHQWADDFPISVLNSK